MLFEKVQEKLEDWEHQSLSRTRLTISRTEANQVTVNSLPCIHFCKNDYLGLGKHPKIIEATIQGLQHYGLGSGASSVVAGYYSSQQKCEEEFAEWLGVDRAILFSSGYLANLGVMATLADRSCTVFSDKMSHASLLDGIQLSRAKHYRYRHRDLVDLSRLAQFKKPDLIISEGVFSMEGCMAPLKSLIEIADQYQASVIIDDAHGIGVLGEEGRGICEHSGIDPRKLACLIAPMGKAFNAMGAMVAGRAEIIEAILQFTRTYRYSTALPPAIAEGILATLHVIKVERWRREKLKDLIHFFTEKALEKGLVLSSTECTPIKSIIIGDSQRVVALQKHLLHQGFFVSCIRQPTVPKNSARVRICLNYDHTPVQITGLLDHIARFVSV
jgi:8-amino-7-oxononanoate synthase